MKFEWKAEERRVLFFALQIHTFISLLPGSASWHEVKRLKENLFNYVIKFYDSYLCGLHDSLATQKTEHAKDGT